MGTFILVGSYVGLSNFVFDVECTGAFISLPEALAKGIIDRTVISRHAKASFVWDWYEVQPGDRISIAWRDDVRDVEVTFVIPEVLPDPPQSPDHENVGMHLFRYLQRYCQQL